MTNHSLQNQYWSLILLTSPISSSVHFWLVMEYFSINISTHLFPPRFTPAEVLDLTPRSHPWGKITAPTFWSPAKSIANPPLAGRPGLLNWKGWAHRNFANVGLVAGAGAPDNPPFCRNIETGGWILEKRPLEIKLCLFIKWGFSYIWQHILSIFIWITRFKVLILLLREYQLL